jgi:type IV pilus assembly protein PilW
MRPAAQRQTGFSLVELMVSVAIGLVILAALVALFLGTSRNNREMATANSLIENGRFAIQLLESDLVHAGYWSTHVPAFDDQTSEDVPLDVPGALPDPCLAYTPADWDSNYLDSLIGIPVQLYDAATVCAGVVADLLGSSDVLVVRHVEECVAGTADCPDTTGKLYLQASLCNSDTVPYAFGATGTAAFPLLQRNCVTAAAKRRFISRIYYVRDYAVTAGDGIPTLVRSDFDLVGGTLAHQAAVGLIEGVDALRVELGFDTVGVTGGAVDYTAATEWEDEDTKTRATNRGDGIPDGNFVRCTTAVPCTTAQLMNATAARIYVLARSREPTQGYVDTKTYTLGSSGTLGPFNDGFKRHLYSATVSLPNITGRRARP